jgi:hypothetical protein
MATIYEFYKKLFGKEERGSVRLDRSGGGGGERGEGRIIVIPDFYAKTNYSSYVCPGSIVSHIRTKNAHI